MAKIILKIITPERIVYENEVDEICAPTMAGEIGILPNHTPLVSVLKTGEIRVKREGEIIPLAVSGGVIEVRRADKAGGNQYGEVIILADYSEFAHEIDLEKAKEAYERAKKVMDEKKNARDVDFAKFQSAIDRELNRVAVAGKHLRRGH